MRTGESGEEKKRLRKDEGKEKGMLPLWAYYSFPIGSIASSLMLSNMKNRVEENKGKRMTKRMENLTPLDVPESKSPILIQSPPTPAKFPDDKYDIFKDPKGLKEKAKFEEKLDEWIAGHPTVQSHGKTLKTADFRDFISQMAGIESSYDKDAGAGKPYSGYYGLREGAGKSFEEQILMAYDHLGSIFSENMVKEDVLKGYERGFTPMQTLMKYWNRSNDATNYLYNGVDSSDGVGSMLSIIGNNMTGDIDYSEYLDDAITDPYVITKDERTYPDYIKRARFDGINYSNRDKYFNDVNKFHDPLFKDSTIHVGDTLWGTKNFFAK